MINLLKVAASSAFVGFENTNEPVSQIFNTPAVLLGAGSSQSYTFSYAVDNSESVSRIRINYASVNTNWYQLEGFFSFFNANISTGGLFDIATYVSYSGGNLNITVYVVNLAAVPAVIPAQTYDATYRLFNVPF